MSDLRGGEHYPFVLPALKFGYKDLEPLMDTNTVEIHHSKHHAGYVKNLNAALEHYPNFHSWTVEEILARLDRLPEMIRTSVTNNAGGHANHCFFWEVLKPPPSGPCSPTLVQEIETTFGSFPAFKKEFGRAVLDAFGSGWVVLAADPGQGARLRILTLANHESALSRGLKGVLICDVWEHAYYLMHQNRRSDYLQCFWNLVNWEAVSQRFENAQAKAVGAESGASAVRHLGGRPSTLNAKHP